MTTTLGRTIARTLSTALALTFMPLTATAQNAPGQRTQGPMIVERVQSGFLVAPEVKVTEFDHQTSELVGAYGGWLSDQLFFIGGGGYWLANRSSDREFGYGGLVVGILPRTEGTIGFGVRTLLGAGRATTVRSVTTIDYPDPRILASMPGDGRPGDTRLILPPTPVTRNVRYRSDVFVAEPEANIVVNFSKRFHLTGGVGYRFTGRDRGVRDDFSGVTGTIGLQIGS